MPKAPSVSSQLKKAFEDALERLKRKKPPKPVPQPDPQPRPEPFEPPNPPPISKDTDRKTDPYSNQYVIKLKDAMECVAEVLDKNPFALPKPGADPAETSQNILDWFAGMAEALTTDADPTEQYNAILKLMQKRVLQQSNKLKWKDGPHRSRRS